MKRKKPMIFYSNPFKFKGKKAEKLHEYVQTARKGSYEGGYAQGFLRGGTLGLVIGKKFMELTSKGPEDFMADLSEKEKEFFSRAMSIGLKDFGVQG